MKLRLSSRTKEFFAAGRQCISPPSAVEVPAVSFVATPEVVLVVNVRDRLFLQNGLLKRGICSVLLVLGPAAAVGMMVPEAVMLVAKSKHLPPPL